MKIQFSKTPSKAQKQTLVLPLHDDATPKADALTTGELKNIAALIKSSPVFEYKTGQTLHIPLDDKRTVIILGLGKKTDWSEKEAETAGGQLIPTLKAHGIQSASLLVGTLKHAAHIAAGLYLRAYTFNKYKTDKDSNKNALKTIILVSKNNADIKKTYATLSPTLEGTYFARDLVNEAPNALYPEAYAERIKNELKPLGVKVTVLDDKKMEKLGMGAITAVGQGSAHKPRMVIMEWKNAPSKSANKGQPIAFVGKGVTFDTGGISIKPGAGMDEMKMDMGGSAAVVGTMKALAASKAKTHVVGIVGLAENMPSSNAYRPGDIITAYNGKTIEVLNTDAEGRLVLADTLSYVQEKYNPHTIIDLATLTGAMMVALGGEYTGTFANDDDLWKALDKSAKIGHEKIWRMPLDQVWSDEVISTVADLRNMGKTRYAGANTAAAFLEHFIDKDRKWAHMDIAGTAWIRADKPTTPKYGTGVGVRTLTAFAIGE